MLVYIATELTLMPAMTAYVDDYSTPAVYINDSFVEEAEAAARECLRDALKDLYTPWVHCSTRAQCGECLERARKERAIVAAINAGHGR